MTFYVLQGVRDAAVELLHTLVAVHAEVNLPLVLWAYSYFKTIFLYLLLRWFLSGLVNSEISLLLGLLCNINFSLRRSLLVVSLYWTRRLVFLLKA